MSSFFFPEPQLRVWPVTNLNTTQRYLGRRSDLEALRLIERRREGFLLDSYEQGAEALLIEVLKKWRS